MGINNNIKFTDLAALEYDPLAIENGKIDFIKGMKRIHAIKRIKGKETETTAEKKDSASASATLLHDEDYRYEVMDGVEVFRQVYELIGLGYLYAVTKFPVVGPAVDKLYDIWALYRFKLTGRPELEELLRERQEKVDAQL